MTGRHDAMAAAMMMVAHEIWRPRPRVLIAAERERTKLACPVAAQWLLRRKAETDRNARRLDAWAELRREAAAVEERA